MHTGKQTAISFQEKQVVNLIQNMSYLYLQHYRQIIDLYTQFLVIWGYKFVKKN